MSVPTLVSVSTTSITVQWTAQSSPTNGNSAITTYNLYWDNGSGTTNIALIDSLVTSHTVTSLTGGTTYKFKVRSQNIYGYGAFSNELSVVASDVPDEMATITTAS